METSVHQNSSLPQMGTQARPSLSEILIRPFQPGDEVPFRQLNEAWISKYFVIEDAERDILNDPVGNILAIGGQIFMATAESLPVGCCALIPMQPDGFELAKMAVAENLRGKGIGRKLLEYAITQARKLGASRLYLETNRKLANAIHLYESVGFERVSPDLVIPSPYARANVFMEMKI